MIESSRSLSHVDIRVATLSYAAPPARSRPAVPCGSHGRRCRDTHASTRRSAPNHAAPHACSRPAIPKRSRGRRCQDVRPARGQWSRLGPRPAVPLRTAPCSSGVALALPAVPVWPTAGGARAPRGACCLVLVMPVRSRRWRVHQVRPSGTARGSSELVKAHTPCRGRPSCRNTAWRAKRAARKPSPAHSHSVHRPLHLPCLHMDSSCIGNGQSGERSDSPDK
jgi:hypothetical protein